MDIDFYPCLFHICRDHYVFTLTQLKWWHMNRFSDIKPTIYFWDEYTGSIYTILLISYWLGLLILSLWGPGEVWFLLVFFFFFTSMNFITFIVVWWSSQSNFIAFPSQISSPSPQPTNLSPLVAISFSKSESVSILQSSLYPFFRFYI